MFRLLMIVLTSLTMFGCFFDNFGPPPKEKDIDPAQRYHDRSDDEGEGRGEAVR